MKRAGDVDEAGLDAMEGEVRAAMEKTSHALANTARLWDDGIIDPRDTREILSFVLDVCTEADARQVNTNTFGIARF